MYLEDTMCENTYWAKLAQDRDYQRTFVNEVLNLRISKRPGISSLAEWISASEKEPCSMELVNHGVQFFCVLCFFL